MSAGECSNSKPCEPSTSSQAAGGAWAKLVPADSAYPEVEVAEDDAVVCSLVAPAGGEELAWCEIRRGGDASSATIRNLSSDAIIVDGRVIQEEAVDIKPGSEIVPGPQKEGYLVYTFDITAAKDHDKNNIKIVLDVENAKCSICLNLWHDVVTVAPCFHNFCNGCFSEWLRSSTNSRDKSQSAACPQCRMAVQSVGRNHFLHNIEEAILQAFSSLQRSDEEIALLESYASVKSNLMPPRRAVAGRGRGRGPLPPPPPVHPTLAQVMTLAQGMAQQTRLLEAIAASQRTGAASRGSRFGEFMSTKPPIFSSADEPLEAEDWLRTIEKKLTLAQCREEDRVLFATHQLAGPAADWWDNYLAARVGEEPEVTAATEEEVAEDEEAEVMTLAQGMAQQTRLLEAIASSQRTGTASRGSRFGEFMSTKPPIFSSADEPLEAEDWLRTIEKKLTLAQCREEDKVLFATHQLAGPAADWWDNYLAARVGEELEVTAATEEEVAEDEEAEVQAAVEVTAPEIEWTEFKEAFRSNYIPSSVMRMKRNEFRMLKQGNSSVAEYLTRFNQLARYAQNDIADEGEKIDRFMEGLHDGLQVQLIVHDFHSFQHLVNKTLLLENERKTFEASRKRKMGTSRAPTPSHRPFYIAPSSSGAQPIALPRATAPANRPSSASHATPVRPSQPQQVGTALANLVCLKCGGTGHYARNCGQQPMTPVRFNINTLARPPSTPGTAVRGRPLTSSAPRTTSFQGQGRVNHITAEEAQ